MEDINLEEELPLKEVEIKGAKNQNKKSKSNVEPPQDNVVVNCLRNERVIVIFIPKTSGIWGNNPKHILAGGMAEGSVITLSVPRLSSGLFVNVLTDNEKQFLEQIMGLEYNALSIYKKVDNFWDDSNENGISRVRLTKQDNYLNLADPEDYIRYKILLANKDIIAPSLTVLQDTPKATYRFVIVSEGDTNKIAKDNMSATMKCYKEYGKIENDADTLRCIIQTLERKPVATTTKLELLQTKINELIQLDSKLFLKCITDPMLPTKVLLNKSIEQGLVSRRGNYLYLRDGDIPLCESGEEPTLNIAAKFLNDPIHQEIKFTLEAKLK